MRDDNPTPSPSSRRWFSRRLKKGLLAIGGTVFLVLGCVGILLPVLPTTPFILLSAACYYRSSDRMHRWMLNNRFFGGYIRNYKEGKGISARAKVFAMLLLWTAICYSAFFVIPSLIAQIVLMSIASIVSIHILTLPTMNA